jgi:hypothetical protein
VLAHPLRVLFLGAALLLLTIHAARAELGPATAAQVQDTAA